MANAYRNRYSPSGDMLVLNAYRNRCRPLGDTLAANAYQTHPMQLVCEYVNLSINFSVQAWHTYTFIDESHVVASRHMVPESPSQEQSGMAWALLIDQVLLFNIILPSFFALEIEFNS